MEAIFKGENILEFIKVFFNEITYQDRFFSIDGVSKIGQGYDDELY